MPTPISTIIPSMISTGITLSNGNLTFANSTASDKIIPTYPLLRFGKWYWEVTNGATYGTTTVRMVGISNMSNNFATFLGSTNNTLGYNGAGTVTFNNATVTTIQTYTTNSVICIALDLVNNTIYFRTGAGLWNNSGTADPDTNVGGIALTFTDGLYIRPALGCSTINNGATVNFGASAFAHTKPTNFNAVDTWTYSTDFANHNSTVTKVETVTTNLPTVRTTNNQINQRSSLPATTQPIYSAFYGDRRPYSPAGYDAFVAGNTFTGGLSVSGTKIHVYDNVSGELLNTKYSSADKYLISTVGRSKVTVVAKHSTSYNALVYSDVTSINFPHYMNLLDADGESNSMTAWDIRLGSGPFTPTNAAYAFSGTRHIRFDANAAFASWDQTLMIPNSLYDLIDTGRYRLAASWVDGSSATDNDTYRCLLWAFGTGTSSNDYLTSTTSVFVNPADISGGGPPTVRSGNCELPIGTRNVRIGFHGTRVSGTELSCYFDDIKLWIEPDFKKTLVLYSNWGDGTTGWTGDALTTNSTWNDHGLTGLTPGSVASALSTRVIDFNSEQLSLVATGLATARLRGILYNENIDDQGRLYAEFMNSSNSVVATIESASSPTTYTERVSVVGGVPTTATKVRVGLQFTRVDGTVLDASASVINLVLFGS